MTVLALILVGLGAGTIAAMLGIGGGVIYVPALVAFFSFAQPEAAGTSLAVIFASMIIAAATHHAADRVDWRAWLYLTATGVVGAAAGSLLAQRADELVLRRVFAVLLVIVAARMILRVERERRGSPADGDPEIT